MPKCLVCVEKDKEVAILKTRVTDILKAARKDKALLIKAVWVEGWVILGLVVILFMVLAFGGREGIMLILEHLPLGD